MISRYIHAALRKRVLAILAMVATVLAMTSPAAASQDAAAEEALKAAFIYNFAKFTQWPDLDQDDPVHFCIQTDTIDTKIFARWEQKSIKGHPIKVSFVSGDTNTLPKDCSLLFIRYTEAETLLSLLKKANDANILTVSDRVNFASNGGHIELFQEDKKLRFRVNLSALNNARLSLGSGMLRLAELVKSKR